MKNSVTFRHMDASDALRDHALEKIDRMSRYFNPAAEAEAHVVLGVEKFLHRAEVNILANGMAIHGKDLSSDMYSSIDGALAKVEKQIKRYRDKFIKKRPKEGAKLKMRFNLLEGDVSDEGPCELPPTVIETKEFQAHPMMLDEAVMQMDLLGNDLLVFLNVKSELINILYRKKGGRYGLIETYAKDVE